MYQEVVDEFIDRELNSSDFGGALNVLNRFDISHEGIKSAGRSRIFLEDVLEDLAVNRLVPKLKLACANIQFSSRP
jgi:hypothetical protein